MSTTKQYEKYMAVLARHVGQHLVDEVKRKPASGKNADPSNYVLSKTPKDRSALFKESSRKVSDFSRSTPPAAIILTTCVGAFPFQQYKEMPKYYLPQFNLYGRAVDIAEYLSKLFVGSYANIEAYHVALVTFGIWRYIETYLRPVVGSNLSSVGERPESMKVLNDVKNYLEYYSDESARKNNEKILHQRGFQFLQCFSDSLIRANGEDTRATRSGYNGSFELQSRTKQPVQIMQLDHSFVDSCANAVVTYMSQINLDMTELNMTGLPLIEGETRESIRLVDLPLLGLKTRVLSDVYVCVPSTRLEPYKVERKMKVEKSSFDDQPDEFITQVMYNGPFQHLNGRKDLAHLFTYAYPLGFTEDKNSLNEKHESKGAKHEKNSLHDIYDSLLKTMVDYCLFKSVDVKTGTLANTNFSILLDSCTKAASFSSMSSSDAKKYLSFLDVVTDINDPKKKLLTGISLVSATNFSNGENMPEDLKQYLFRIRAQVTEIAMRISAVTYDQVNRRVRPMSELNSQAKEYVTSEAEKIKDILRPHLYNLYRYFSGVRTQTAKNSDTYAREVYGRNEGLAIIYRYTTQYESMTVKQAARPGVQSGVMGVQSGVMGAAQSSLDNF